MQAVVFVTELVSESLLPGKHPLALLPLIDRPLLQHRIETLVEQGVSRIQIVTCAGVERIRTVLGDGARWGCSITVSAFSWNQPLQCLSALPESEEPTLVTLAERLPLMPSTSLCPSLSVTASGQWAGSCIAPASLLRRLPKEVLPVSIGGFLSGALPEEQVPVQAITTLSELLLAQRGELERRPTGGVHVARSARVHSRAQLTGPVWIGPHCRIGTDVQLGPNVCLGAGCIVERGTQIQEAIVAPGSYIGANLELNGVYVDRNRLINLHQGIGLTIEEGFLLGSAPTRLAFR